MHFSPFQISSVDRGKTKNTKSPVTKSTKWPHHDRINHTPIILSMTVFPNQGNQDRLFPGHKITSCKKNTSCPLADVPNINLNFHTREWSIPTYLFCISTPDFPGTICSEQCYASTAWCLSQSYAMLTYSRWYSSPHRSPTSFLPSCLRYNFVR